MSPNAQIHGSSHGTWKLQIDHLESRIAALFKPNLANLSWRFDCGSWTLNMWTVPLFDEQHR